MDRAPDRPTAIISVSDKRGVKDFALGLKRLGWEISSTGGTARLLEASGVRCRRASEVTGHPEMMEGRVKTLHPAIHAGILARRENPEDMRELAEAGYRQVDLVAVNLYPFGKRAAEAGSDWAKAMEAVDIGGPALLRAAAKNHRSVWAVVDPSDYDRVLARLARGRGAEDGAALRRRLAAKVFRHISAYDREIGRVLSQGDRRSKDGRPAPWALRYGENHGQSASFHPAGEGDRGIASLEVVHGKALSYNNILDIDSVLYALAPFARHPWAHAVLVKHGVPCGAASRDTSARAFERARAADPVSAFGSVAGFSRPVDAEAAKKISTLFVECVVAPDFSREALRALKRKKNLRILAFPEGIAADAFLAGYSGAADGSFSRTVYGGRLTQTGPPIAKESGSRPDRIPRGWSIAGGRRPNQRETTDLNFAWACVAAVKSNAVVIAKDGATIGVGSGQMSRVDSVRLAAQKARDAGFSKELRGACLASDGFFPFRDGVDLAASLGVRAIVHPGGSIRDDESIEAATEHGIVLATTGERLFRH